jgi:hypothetical protein
MWGKYGEEGDRLIFCIIKFRLFGESQCNAPENKRQQCDDKYIGESIAL